MSQDSQEYNRTSLRLKQAEQAATCRDFLRRSLDAWEAELIQSLKRKNLDRDEVYEIRCLLVAKERFVEQIESLILDGKLVEQEQAEEL